MAKLKTEEMVEIMERTKTSCDKNCAECEMFLPSYDMCFHEAEKQRQEWNKKNSEKFQKLLNS